MMENASTTRDFLLLKQGTRVVLGQSNPTFLVQKSNVWFCQNTSLVGINMKQKGRTLAKSRFSLEGSSMNESICILDSILFAIGNFGNQYTNPMTSQLKLIEVTLDCIKLLYH